GRMRRRGTPDPLPARMKSPEPAALASRRPLAASLFGVWLFNLLFYVHGGQDDTYITYWAARTVAEHGQILNYNGARVEQSSSLALVVILGVLSKALPLSLPTLGYLTGVGASSGALY